MNENPKKIASDVANGLQTFNSSNLKRFDPGALKIVVSHLNSFQKTVRQEVIAMDDPDYTEKTKEKNLKMGRIRNALTIIKAYANRRGLKGII